MKTKAILENAVYTSSEVQELLKISPSTFKRLTKSGGIKASKVGGQYRILGVELLNMIRSSGRS